MLVGTALDVVPFGQRLVALSREDQNVVLTLPDDFKTDEHISENIAGFRRDHRGFCALGMKKKFQLFIRHFTPPLSASVTPELAFAGAKCHSLLSVEATVALEYEAGYTRPACASSVSVVCTDNSITGAYLCQGGLMAQPALGLLLQKLREERGLSLRELMQL